MVLIATFCMNPTPLIPLIRVADSSPTAISIRCEGIDISN